MCDHITIFGAKKIWDLGAKFEDFEASSKDFSKGARVSVWRSFEGTRGTYCKDTQNGTLYHLWYFPASMMGAARDFFKTESMGREVFTVVTIAVPDMLERNGSIRNERLFRRGTRLARGDGKLKKFTHIYKNNGVSLEVCDILRVMYKWNGGIQ